ncbi:MAG: hypothetical protein ACLFNW_13425, partial [Desulfobacterales bacterium]
MIDQVQLRPYCLIRTPLKKTRRQVFMLVLPTVCKAKKAGFRPACSTIESKIDGFVKSPISALRCIPAE